MLQKILTQNTNENTLSEYYHAIRQGIPSAIFGVTDAFKGFLVGNMDDKVLLVVKDTITAGFYQNLITEFSSKECVVVPAKDEILTLNKAYSKDRQFERICALDKIEKAQVVIVTIEALMQTFPKKINSLNVELNAEIDRDTFISELVKMGYTRVESAESQGVFSVRGDIINLFPVGEQNPFRIDFFGDSVEDIKEFDLETRRSVAHHSAIKILQKSEFVFSADDELKLLSIINEEIKKADKTRYLRLIEIKQQIEGATNGNLDALSNYSTVLENSCTLFDLLGKDTVVVIDESKRVYELSCLLEKEFTERFNSLFASGEVFDFQKSNLLVVEEVEKKFKGFRNTTMQNLSSTVKFFNPLKIIHPKVSGVIDYQLDFKEVFSDIDSWLRSGYTVVVCTGTIKRAEDFSLELSTRNIPSTINTKKEIQGVCISTEKLSKGFIYHEEKLVVIGSGNLYAKPVQEKRLKLKKSIYFSAPEPGDYCVHEVHGVGKVLGSKKISSTEGTKDYVAVEYAGGDLLYIPVEQMDILTRYVGGDKKPRLSRIGGKDFERVKNSVKESIKKMSFDLKRLYQEREEQKGFAFKTDSELQRLFESSFAYEDTLDQTTANLEIEADMTSGKVMDRLVCGDVGFGKTEVAFRAVFRAVVNGKQAVLLAPTTILTEQHYNTALERFKNFGVKIACLNRFKSPKEQQQILDLIKKGEIDFIIGTHRLLSKDVQFKDLGLLVLDEEQRFGVEHKERIKLLKKNVDALTLTATPIPRTLHMSLSGIRAISTITTPPKKRLPVQTYVTELTDALIKDSVLKELNRGGQAFILYNRVESILNFAEHVKKLLPQAKITVAHGQMDEKKLEANILEFYSGKSDLLISTTIIENGIDLPKANTIIVVDADRLGLSTLYQLKGRVGRSERLAYAYFTFSKDKILTDSAFERLNAIIEFAEMGSGIKIAMRDLEIRGAGNILGAEQHGHMDKIGYELYSKLLKEEMTGVQEIAPELDIRVTAYIPDKYVESNTRRMDSYKEIAEISSLQEEKEFIETLTENYGALPIEAENLINIAVVKMLSAKLGVCKITVSKGDVSLQFGNFNSLSNEKIYNAIKSFGETVRLNMSLAPVVTFERIDANNSDMLKLVREFLVLASY